MSTAAERALRSGRQGSAWDRGFAVTETGGTIDLDTVRMQIRRGPGENAQLVASSYDWEELGVAQIDLTGTTNTAPKRWRWKVTDTDTAGIEPGDLWVHAIADATPDGEPTRTETLAYHLFKCLPRVVVL